MKKTYPSLILFAAILVFIGSCKKKEYEYYECMCAVAPTIDDIFRNLRSTPQTITIPAGTDTIVFGTKGTLLHIYPNSFHTYEGKLIRFGTIDITFTEIYRPGEMIAERTTTLSGDQLVQSCGQIRMRATVNGNEVTFTKYGIGFKQDTQGATTTHLFSGGSYNENLVVSWKISDTNVSGRSAVFTNDPTGSFSIAYGSPWAGYVFDSNSSYTFTNGGAIYATDSPLVGVKVFLPDSTFTPDNTELYLVLPDVNCAMASIRPRGNHMNYRWPDNSLRIVGEHGSDIAPAGMNYKLVVIAKKDGQYYYYEQDGTIPQNGLTATAALVPETENSIKVKLASF